MQACPKCQELKTEDQFYIRKDRTGKAHSWCKLCMNFQALSRQRALKQTCIDYKGGKCEKCNYSKCNRSFRISPLGSIKERLFNFSSKQNNF